MSKKGENIHKRKDGRWEARYKRGRNENGGIYYGYLYGKSYNEVKRKLLSTKVQESEMRACGAFNKTLLYAADLWLKNNKLRLKGATLSKYKTIINTHIIPQLGGYKLSQLSAILINSYLAEKLRKGRLDKRGALSASYVNSIRIVLKAVIKFAVKEQMMLPLKGDISKPNIKKNELSVLSAETQKKLETELMRDMDFVKFGILLSLKTGLRIGEVCALKWEDVDTENGILHIRHTVSRVQNDLPDAKTSSMLILDTPKTGSSKRDIPISNRLLPVIESIKRKSKGKFVLSNSNMFLSPRTYEYKYHRLLKACGVEQVNYHTLRHTFATRCIEAGVDVKSLSEMLGHSGVGITLNTYVHSSMELKRAQLEKLNSFSA